MPETTVPRLAPLKLSAKRGHASFKYDIHQQRVRLGDGEMLFDVRWERSQNSFSPRFKVSGADAPLLIRVYEGILSTWDELPTLDASDQAMLEVGSTALLSNQFGHFAFLDLLAVVDPEHDEEPYLRFRYRIVEKSHPSVALLSRDSSATAPKDLGAVSDGEPTFELYPNYSELRQSATATRGMLLDLYTDERTQRLSENRHGGPGHNLALPPLLADPAAQTQAIAALDTIIQSDLEQADASHRGAIVQAGKVLWDLARDLVAWVAPKLDKAADTWFQEMAKTMSAPHRIAVVWMAVSGQLQAIAEAAMRLAGGG